MLDTSLPVLLVDDYQTMVRIVRTLLRQIGFLDVDEAGDGAEGLQKLRQRPYGLIISDWNMQPVSGHDFLRAVRSNAGTKDIPFILVTAESKTDTFLAARKAGASAYLVKPFSAQTLRGKIERACAR